MNTSDIHANRRSEADALAPASAEVERWRTLVGEVGAEIAAPLTSALERIVALTSSGRIDRHSLRALREDVERARQIGIESQQLARLAGGLVRQSQEMVDLSEMLAGVQAHRTREFQARGLELSGPPHKAVAVQCDSSLLFCLVNAMVSWALDCAWQTIEIDTQVQRWPSPAGLSCRFTQRPGDRLDDGAALPASSPALDSMHWRLLEHTANALGVSLNRQVDGAAVALNLSFQNGARDAVEGMSAIEMDEGFAPAMNCKPLAGNHVLVVAQRREVRAEIREALRSMGLIVDFVSSIDEAQAFCRDGLPHAIVIEALLCAERFDELRSEIAAEVPQFVFIQIIEDSRAFEMSGFGPASTARVGRDVLAQSLPSALLFELSRAG